MCENLFHGKRKDNGEWVEGYLVIADERYFIAKCPECITSLYYPDDIYSFTGFVEVIPETVGPYTGLTDKNSKKIFDSDIIQAVAMDTNNKLNAVVRLGTFVDDNTDEEYLGCYIELNGIKLSASQLTVEKCKNSFEVIGNIHDNPI